MHATRLEVGGTASRARGRGMAEREIDAEEDIEITVCIRGPLRRWQDAGSPRNKQRKERGGWRRNVAVKQLLRTCYVSEQEE